MFIWNHRFSNLRHEDTYFVSSFGEPYLMELKNLKSEGKVIINQIFPGNSCTKCYI